MLNTIWNLIPKQIKVSLNICLIIAIVALSGTLWYKSNRLELVRSDLSNYKNMLAYERLIYEEERQNAINTITEQNALIEEYSINNNAYIRSIYQRSLELEQLRSIKEKEIIEELKKDSSIENQFRVVETLLKDFANETN